VKYSTRLRFFQITYSYVLFSISLKEWNIAHLSIPVFCICLEWILYFHICSVENVDNDFEQKINYSIYSSRNVAFRSLLFYNFIILFILFYYYYYYFIILLYYFIIIILYYYYIIILLFYNFIILFISFYYFIYIIIIILYYYYIIIILFYYIIYILYYFIIHMFYSAFLSKNEISRTSQSLYFIFVWN